MPLLNEKQVALTEAIDRLNINPWHKRLMHKYCLDALAEAFENGRELKTMGVTAHETYAKTS